MGGDLLANSELTRMVEDDGLRGVTSNPAVFHEAVSRSGLDRAIQELQEEGVDRFAQSLAALMQATDQKRKALPATASP